MTDLTARNLVAYVCLWAGNALAGCLAAALAAGSVPGFADGQFLAPVAPELAAGLSLAVAGLTMWLAANRPRFGREDISQLVGEVGAFNARGVLHDMLAGRVRSSFASLSDAEIDRIADRVVDRIEARMQATPSGG